MWALRELSTFLPLLLLARLFQQGLWKVRPYSALGVFLLVDLARDLALLLPPYDSHPYTLIWEATLPVLLLAQIGAGVATYAAITELYPKIGPFAVKLFAACLILACLAGLVLLPFEVKRIGADEAPVRVFILVQRWVATLLAGGLVLAVLFLARFPRPLKKMPRNIMTHTACIALYFASYALLYAIKNLKSMHGAQWAAQGQLGFVCVLYLAWTVGLSKAGQASEPWRQLDPAVKQMLDRRYERALEWMRQAAGDGRK
jgi:hypothetical protein